MNTGDLYSFWGAIFTRVGAIVLITFGVQILINLYKYNMRMSAFYDSLADSLELNKDTIDETLYKLIKNFSPDKIDFGKNSKTPINEAIELTKQIVGKAKSIPPETE
jgi:hypothetical protein